VKKRLAVYTLIIALLLVAWVAVHDFSTELSALAWHAQHGFHAQIGDFRVQVPLAYEADDSFSISRMPGRLTGPGGFIMFDFQQRLPSPEQREAAEALIKKKGYKLPLQTVKVAERPAAFAGRPGKCIEYSPAIAELRLVTAEIDCNFDGDVSVQFIGSGNLRNDFYNIIQTAEPAKRKD